MCETKSSHYYLIERLLVKMYFSVLDASSLRKLKTAWKMARQLLTVLDIQS
jgi:hypothetical protein